MLIYLFALEEITFFRLYCIYRSTFSRSSSVKYDVSYASKPVDDLEYDPMCNFNIKKHDSKPAKSSDLIVVGLYQNFD